MMRFIQHLLSQSTRTDRGILIAEELLKYLHQRRIIVPGIDVVERTCAEAMTLGDKAVYTTLNTHLSAIHKSAFDALLMTTEKQISRLTWLLQPPGKINGKNVLQHIDRLNAIEALALPEGVDRTVHQNRLLKLAREGRKMSSRDLADFAPARRYATMVCVLTEARATIIDEIIELHERILGSMFSRAKRQQAERLQKTGKLIQFGKSSEKLREKTARQVREAEERIGALQEEMAEVLGEQHDPALPQPLRQSSARKPLPASLPHETRTLSPAETVCPACGGDLSPQGCDVSEQLELISSAFKVIETQRPKLACRCCDHIVQAPMPSKPIERSYAGPGLLARIVTAKFAEHTPHYRQSEIYRRQGVELSRATLGRWSGAVSELLEPLYDLLRQYVLMPGKVHTDDIPVPVQEPGSGKTRTARLWVYVRDDRNAGSQLPPAVWFAYSPDRKGVHPQRHLAGYGGILQADAYGGYNALYEDGRITEAACMAHARRKIHDVHVRTPTDITTEALRRIGELYAIKAEIRGSPADERLAVRKEKTVPLMRSLYDWIQVQIKVLSRHSDTAKAFAYLVKQWDALNLYCSNGWVEIDNNIAENALRGVALGRKNWLFAGSDAGGERAAVLYSLIGTCRLNGVEPEAWLRYVLGHIQDWPVNRLRDLLPWKTDLTSA